LSQIDTGLLEIRQGMLNGDYSAQLELIKKWLKRHTPNHYEKILLSELYTWMGKDELSWKILGRPKSLSELQQLPTGELCVQLRLGYVLGMLGGKYLSLYLIESTCALIKERNLDLTQHYPQFYQNSGYLYLTFYMPDQAQTAFEKALTLYPSDSYQYFYISIGLSDCDSQKENYSRAIERVEALLVQFTDQTLLAVGHQALGEYLNLAGDREKALKAFQRAEVLFGEDQQTKDYAYLKKHQGLYYFFLGDYELALKEFEKARKILSAKDQTPSSLIEIYYWMERINPESLSLAERLALRVYPHYSLYAFLVGRERSPQDTTVIPSWLESSFKASEGNVWEIDQSEIRELKYAPLQSLNRFGVASLDLVSGLIKREGLPSKLLSPLQSSLLISLIGGGKRGVHEFLLLDRSYRQSFIDYDSALDRLKKAVSGLKEFGLKVQKEKMTYSLEIDFKDWYLLIPRDLKSRLYYPYVMVHFPAGFQTQDLVKLFGVNRRTIQRWVKDWREKNLIHAMNSDQIYCWSETSFSLEI